MKICLVSQEYPPETGGGGIGTQTYLKAHGLARRGHTVHVITSTYEGAGFSRQDAGVTVHRIGDPSSDAPFSEPSVHWIGYSWAVAKKVHELSEAVGFDLIEFPEYGAEGFIYELDTAQWREIPVVVCMHGSLTMFAERTDWPPKESDFYRVGIFMEETVVRKADSLFAVSRNVAKFWSDRCGIPLERINVLHPSVDPTLFSPTSDTTRGRPTVLFVGRVAEDKGLFTLAEAALKLRQKHPAVLLRIAGTGDEDSVLWLEETIKANKAEDTFELLGHVAYQDLPRVYAACDVFAAPAPQEHGLGIVYLEAMATAKPVVACRTAGAPEAVIDGQTGILVSPGDVEGLVEVLDKLLNRPDLRERLGRNGRQMVLSHFSVDQHIRRAERIYKELLGEWKKEHSHAAC
jgi:glycosyltransferase involved in cell wall biosynthesis